MIVWLIMTIHGKLIYYQVFEISGFGNPLIVSCGLLCTYTLAQIIYVSDILIVATGYLGHQPTTASSGYTQAWLHWVPAGPSSSSILPLPWSSSPCAVSTTGWYCHKNIKNQIPIYLLHIHNWRSIASIKYKAKCVDNACMCLIISW